MTNYTLAKKISETWSIKKSREELKNELYQLLILLPTTDLQEIQKNDQRIYENCECESLSDCNCS